MKRIITLVLTLAALLVLTVTACADTIPGTAKLTITPTDTKVSGDTATYSVTVTPPEGKELGVFSVQLQPSDGMTLAKDFYANGKQVITYGDGKLSYSEVKQTGYFATYEYTPQTGYFAAVGTTPERRMSKEPTILTIQATMPANKDGTYTLNAEFIAALDGSGDVYTAQVSTTPVTISNGKEPVADKTPVVTETDGSGNTTNTNDTTGAANNGTTPNGGTTTDGTAPNGTAPDGTTPDSTAPDGTAPDGTTPNGGTNDTATTGSSPILWIVLAAALIAAAVIVIVVKKKKQ